MPSLRKSRKRLRTWLMIIAVPLSLALLDATRSPADQEMVKIYISAIRCYQRFCQSTVSQFVCCRYHPCCSEYCLLAAQRHGICKGLLLGAKRVLSCAQNIPHGTLDPVPD